ncbi:MAG: hypothetical protein IJU76_08790 [Desulfovibrionaceae bacterium]|nr:hypothetical protein [Desulfovibrionaceae bacterium]
MANTKQLSDQAWLDTLFPASRTDDFFEALFGGAEEGAYDIQLVFCDQDENTVHMAFNLIQRPGQCLRCNLTYGLPQVFARHPVLNIKEVAQKIADSLGWTKFSWQLKHTEEIDNSLHRIPFVIEKGSV